MMYRMDMGEDKAHRIPADAVEVTASELRTNLRDLLERVAFAEDELVVTRAGKPIAAVISMDAFVALRKFIRGYEDAADAEAIAGARSEGEYLPLDDVLKARG